MRFIHIYSPRIDAQSNIIIDKNHE